MVVPFGEDMGVIDADRFCGERINLSSLCLCSFLMEGDPRRDLLEEDRFTDKSIIDFSIIGNLEICLFVKALSTEESTTGVLTGDGTSASQDSLTARHRFGVSIRGIDLAPPLGLSCSLIIVGSILFPLVVSAAVG